MAPSSRKRQPNRFRKRGFGVRFEKLPGPTRRFHVEEPPPPPPVPNEVIQITRQDVHDFAEVVDDAVSVSVVKGGLDTVKFSQFITTEANRLAAVRMNTLASKEHKVRYDPHGIEYTEWMMALMLMARSAEILRRKARDGHCYVHKTPCAESIPFNRRVYEACLDSLDTMLQELRSKNLEDPN